MYPINTWSCFTYPMRGHDQSGGVFLIRQWVSSKYRSHSAFEEVCSMAYWCFAFCAFSSVFLHLLLTHINTNHNNEEQFFAYCGIDEREARFRRANSLAKHVREKHRTHLYSCRENLMLQSTANGTGMSDLRCVQRIIKNVDRERAYSWIHLIRSRGKVRGHMLSSRGGGGDERWYGWGGWVRDQKNIPFIALYIKTCVI